MTAPNTARDRDPQAARPSSSLFHLARRFVGSLSRKTPAESDVVWALGALLEGEQRLWTQQSRPDQRHTIEVARRACLVMPSVEDEEHRPLLAGILLHDIGKIESGLGTFGRVLATVCGAVVGERARTGDGRVSRYLRHEPLGEALVRAAGSHPMTIAVVGRSPELSAATLALLEDADDV